MPHIRCLRSVDGSKLIQKLFALKLISTQFPEPIMDGLS
uniref:Uncharacterized protein n=1 Tax=Rhizophora mucronata TaxID=61149 RepID=A0A2P2J439_RHIMU